MTSHVDTGVKRGSTPREHISFFNVQIFSLFIVPLSLKFFLKGGIIGIDYHNIVHLQLNRFFDIARHFRNVQGILTELYNPKTASCCVNERL